MKHTNILGYVLLNIENMNQINYHLQNNVAIIVKVKKNLYIYIFIYLFSYIFIYLIKKEIEYCVHHKVQFR